MQWPIVHVLRANETLKNVAGMTAPGFHQFTCFLHDYNIEKVNNAE
jgi:hypothetical protein